MCWTVCVAGVDLICLCEDACVRCFDVVSWGPYGNDMPTAM